MRFAPVLVAFLVLSGTLLDAVSAAAHEIRLARIGISTGEGGILVDVKLPATIEPHAPTVPAGCESTVAEPPRKIGRAIYAAWQIVCPGMGLPRTLQLPWQLDGALVIRTTSDGETTEQHLRAGSDGFTLDIEDTGRGGIFLRYFEIGVRHILSGLDHLALIACLCLLATGWHLLKLVTAFTLGHSVTLAFGAFGYLKVSVAPLEALVAFSIAIFAREVLLGRRARGYGLAAAFGLLHGLAFASELATLSPTRIVPALLAFNLGVEAGQLLFVACIVVLITLLSTARVNRAWIDRSAAALIGCFAIFWSIERVAVILA